MPIGRLFVRPCHVQHCHLVLLDHSSLLIEDNFSPTNSLRNVVVLNSRNTALEVFYCAHHLLHGGQNLLTNTHVRATVNDRIQLRPKLARLQAPHLLRQALNNVQQRRLCVGDSVQFALHQIGGLEGSSAILTGSEKLIVQGGLEDLIEPSVNLQIYPSLQLHTVHSNRRIETFAHCAVHLCTQHMLGLRHRGIHHEAVFPCRRLT
mmetsp:Transcript_1096/g.3065  ORF Transcript_1096/g.3065 Transcript_1096/m.3065 type:complete len:206 (-) Transcript_1096:146-763(-)